MSFAPGTPAPPFSVPDQTGYVHTLATHAGKWLLIYFYPKDDTPGCTVESCVLRDAYGALRAANCDVLGVSADTIESHQNFIRNHNLPFPLLADTTREMIEAYGVWRWKISPNGKKRGIMRTSFLIDPGGKIAKVYESVGPAGHAEEVLHDLQTLSTRTA